MNDVSADVQSLSQYTCDDIIVLSQLFTVHATQDVNTGIISHTESLPELLVRQVSPVKDIAVMVDKPYNIEIASLVGPPGPQGIQGIAGKAGKAFQGFSSLSIAPTKVVVANVSVKLLSANPLRVYAHIINNSGVRVYLQFHADAVVGSGIPLNSRAMYTISGTDLWLGSVNCVSSSGIVNIDILEAV